MKVSTAKELLQIVLEEFTMSQVLKYIYEKYGDELRDDIWEVNKELKLDLISHAKWLIKKNPKLLKQIEVAD